jgi:tetratricopeptide (TPR) repeat protein
VEDEEEHLQILLKKVKYQPSKDNYNALGNAYFDAQRYDEAIDAYQKALEMDASDPSILSNVGNALFFLDAYDNASQYLRQAIALDPTDATAWAYLGNALYALEQSRAAMGCYRRALEVEPENLEATRNLGNIYHDCQDFKKAVEYFERALKITPEDPTSWANLGNSKRYLKDYTGAEEALKKALEIDPEYAFALFVLGRYYYDLGHYDQVKNLYQRLIEIVPEDSEPHLLLGDALAALGDYEGAIGSYGLAITQDPSDAMGFACRGWVFLQLRRFPEAEVDLKTAAQLDPDDTYSLLNFAYCLALEGKVKPARGLLMKASRKFSNETPDLLLDASEIALLVQDSTLARDYINQALKLEPTLKKKIEKNQFLSKILKSPAEGAEPIKVSKEDLPKTVGRVVSLSEINRIEFLTELQRFTRVEKVLGPIIMQLWEQYESLEGEGAALGEEIAGDQEQKEILAKNKNVEKLSEITARLKNLEKKLSEVQKQGKTALAKLVEQLSSLNVRLDDCDAYLEEHLEENWETFKPTYDKYVAGQISSDDLVRSGLQETGKKFLKILAGRIGGG